MMYSHITLMDYDIIGILSNEMDAIKDVINDIEVYEMDIYESISSVADNYIPSLDLWTNAAFIEEYINEVLEEYGAQPSTIEDILAEGYWKYFTSMLNENIVPIKFNIVAKMVNQYLMKHKLVFTYDVLGKIEMHICYRIDHYETDKIFGLLQVYGEIKDFLEGIGELDV